MTDVTKMVNYILEMEDIDAPFSWADVSNSPRNLRVLQNELESVGRTISELKFNLESPFPLEEGCETDAYDRKDLLELFLRKAEKRQKKLKEELEKVDGQDVVEWLILPEDICKNLKEKGKTVIEKFSVWGRKLNESVCEGFNPEYTIDKTIVARTCVGGKDLYMGVPDLVGAKVLGSEAKKDDYEYSTSFILKTTKGSYIKLIINQER